jgi:hypothetical protein
MGTESEFSSKSRFGEVQETPTQYTLLGRLRDLLTGIVLAAGTNVIGKVRLVTTAGDEITNDTQDAIATLPKMSIVHAEHPFAKGDLTSDGVQETEVDTTTANTDVAVETVTIEPPATGSIVEIEFGLTASFRAVSSTTADLIWKWQARNKDGTWVDLHSAVTEVDIGTAYVERTRSGRFPAVANFDSVPFDVRLIIQCNEANEGRAKIKNSSYVRVIYNAS